MAKLSTQFDFQIVDANLTSFLAVHGALVSAQNAKVDQSIVQQSSFVLEYTHDRITYGATCELSVSVDKYGNNWKNLTLRLCNDGFLYPPREEVHLQSLKTYIHHNTPNWSVLFCVVFIFSPFLNAFNSSLNRVLLAREELAKIPSSLALSDQYLGSGALCRGHYNEEVQRLDIKYIDRANRRGLNVQFEPGYALVDFDNDEEWY